MTAAAPIRNALDRVFTARATVAGSPALAAAVGEIKLIQADRFRRTYADLLVSDVFGAPARFFLNDLYGAQDFSQRDLQFARISGTISRVFPESVVSTAVAIAELHALTEELDLAMARAWGAVGERSTAEKFIRYLCAWQSTGRASDRRLQLTMVEQIGHSMIRLTRTPGLRLMLKMMRHPAHAAGLGSLQSFLENGFDTFQGMQKSGQAAQEFLTTIDQRESQLITQLFACPPDHPDGTLAAQFGNA